MTFTSTIRRKYQRVSRSLDEKSRRLWCATEALAIKKGGIAKVHAATGVSRPTIYKGIRELESKRGRKGKRRRRKQTDGRIRRIGGGAKPKTNKLPTILQALEALVAPEAKGDPQCPLRWTNKGLRKLSSQLKGQGYNVSHTTVGNLLQRLGYSLQLNRKEKEGKSVPDRNAQFQFINDQAKAFMEAREPIISVDTKKKELIGNTKTTTGLKIRAQIDYREYRTQVEVDDEDFKTIAIMKNGFHGEWNYVISPFIAFEVEI
jgi:transposase